MAAPRATCASGYGRRYFPIRSDTATAYTMGSDRHSGEGPCACDAGWLVRSVDLRSEEHTSELQSLMRISYAVFCLKKKKNRNEQHNEHKNEVLYKMLIE